MARQSRKIAKVNKSSQTNKSSQVIELLNVEGYVVHRKTRVEIIPRNEVQEEYYRYLNDNSKKIVFAVGPAGTGKTLLATLQAIKELKDGNISKIIITRPAVEADEKHGFLPGDLNKKMEPWTRPIFDVFEEYYSPKDIQKMIGEGVIEICPLAYMRGRNFKNAFIILDECQNTTPSQLKMALTRICDDSRMIITGDEKQSDQRRLNGLTDFVQKLSACPKSSIAKVTFLKKHIERSAIVQDIVDIYGDEE